MPGRSSRPFRARRGAGGDAAVGTGASPSQAFDRDTFVLGVSF